MRLLRWWLEEYDPLLSNVPQETYQGNSRAMYELFSYLLTSGFWSDMQQANITLRLLPMPDTSKIPDILRDVQMALPFIKEVTGRMGGQRDRDQASTHYRVRTFSARLYREQPKGMALGLHLSRPSGRYLLRGGCTEIL
jgi:hypothetical protein